MNSVTPVWYWRVNHEYIDFLHATIKRMKMSEINDTPGLFEAQRRCSDLNSAVYKYYDNIKKRCLNGEKVSYSDLDVLNLRQCFASSAWKPIRSWWCWSGRSMRALRWILTTCNG
ncbi:putative ATP-dependent RNA helicase-like protein [Enterobacter cloacae]|uniref:Putative ATP-dependent RNA helicase-like protein n=1 Tax=Enterobacter cloacae TaxID=550 RepID=A0A377LV03_ENTCL|nr:putative ATP-dependent RNA helicase-like protein [Enterobacter cloacae]